MKELPSFGENLKRLRKLRDIPSKELSKRVNKSPAYVSSIENGRNKNPSYDVAFDLLKAVGVKENQIDGMLEWFGFRDPEKEKAMIEAELQRIQDEEDMMNDPRYQQMMAEQEAEFWIDVKKDDAHGTNNAIHDKFKKFIDSNIEKTEVILDGLYMLLNGSKSDFDHLYHVMKKVNDKQKESE